MRALHVLRPHAGGESVDGVVGFGDEVLFIAERDGGHDRPEDLLLGDSHLPIDVGEHRRLDEVTVVETLRSLASGKQPRALLVARLDVTQNPLHLRFRNQRSHLAHWVDARPDPRFFDCLHQLVQRLVVDLLLNEKA